jgi:hypothetical protein
VDVQRIWPSIIYIEPEKVSSATLVPFCGRSQPPLTARIELLLRDGKYASAPCGLEQKGGLQ